MLYVYATHTRAEVAFSPKNVAFRLDPNFLGTTTLTKSYFRLELKIVREFLRKRLFFK